MRIDIIMGRWIDILARLWLGWQERRRARNWLKVAQDGNKQDGDKWIVSDAKRTGRTASVTVPAGAPLPDDIARAAQNRFVILELAADEFVARRMSVPAQARDLLPGIVRNQIERLCPWRANQAAYGFDVGPSEDAASLDVRVLVTSRAVLDEACQRLGALGLRVDRVVAGERLADAAIPVVLWSRLADATDKSLARISHTIGGLIAATVCITLIVNVWGFMTAASADSESEDVGTRIAALQRQIKGALPRQSIPSLAPPERAWALKETSPVAVIVVEALSRALPDNSHLTELNLDGATLRIVGFADDAPSLIAPLEQSGHLKDVHFFAPTTRGADGTRFMFHIEARVEAHARIDGG
ncbi:PilN domain-containing protein [Bradyrhizobium sp. Arg237L]|uniref:PilN domain-containing protein n=1 Tax=Bradyrhizobium sp. Arg237L TaxID=3003352 RepID=UPI00249F7E91|nr:PilN domain-containing protein [Bradyrhizobium sp. Arg237L]MDI4235738.1 PilN domain-containing protein [Bradyrhizobium sp. Arg237L]